MAILGQRHRPNMADRESPMRNPFAQQEQPTSGFRQNPSSSLVKEQANHMQKAGLSFFSVHTDALVLPIIPPPKKKEGWALTKWPTLFGVGAESTTESKIMEGFDGNWIEKREMSLTTLYYHCIIKPKPPLKISFVLTQDPHDLIISF